MNSTFKKGDHVKWSSTSGGVEIEKRGEILEVISTDAEMMHFAFKYWDKYSFKKLSRFGKRNHISYLVAVGKYLYWPRVKNLQIDE